MGDLSGVDDRRTRRGLRTHSGDGGRPSVLSLSFPDSVLLVFLSGGTTPSAVLVRSCRGKVTITGPGSLSSDPTRTVGVPLDPGPGGTIDTHTVQLRKYIAKTSTLKDFIRSRVTGLSDNYITLITGDNLGPL